MSSSSYLLRELAAGAPYRGRSRGATSELERWTAAAFAAADAPGGGRAVPVYPVVARAAFFTFFSSTTGPVFLPLVGPDARPFREPEDWLPSRDGVAVVPPRPGAAGLDAAFAFRTSSAFISLRSFIVIGRPIVLWWILPKETRCSELALARAMISANERFFGGAESVGAGRLATGRDGNDLLLYVDDDPAATALAAVAPGFCVGAGLLTRGRDVDTVLSIELPIGLSSGRGDGFEGLPFGLDEESAIDWVRAVFEPAMRSSSSAFRLGNVALGRDAGVGDGVGFSPVIDASKSRIWSNQSASNRPRYKTRQRSPAF